MSKQLCLEIYSKDEVLSDPVDYSNVYNNPRLADTINRYEQRLKVIDDTQNFKSLVNISKSKEQAYYGWLRYREGYSGELVKALINRANIKMDKHFVADPMCGAGTTLVAAKEIGFDSFGMDVNPFAVEITNTKVAKYSLKQLEETEDILNKIGNQKRCKKVINLKLYDCSKYFDKRNFKALIDINEEIENLKKIRVKQLLRLIWLSILEDCSNRKKDGNGLATINTKVENVYRYFKDKGRCILRDLKRKPLPKNVFALAIDESSINFSRELNKIQNKTKKELKAIIFSPPYANSFDYFESYKIELLMGKFYDEKELANSRNRLIRNYRIGYGQEIKTNNEIVEDLCKEIWLSIPKKEADTGKRDGRTRLVPNMLRGYFEDMEKIIKEFGVALKKGGRVYIVVDQSSYVGVIIPTDILFAIAAKKYGFEVENIIKCRRANTSGQQLKRFPYLKTMLRESIVVLKKN